MIDIENKLFTEIANVLRVEFPGIYLAGELDLNPAQFPCAYIEVADNYALQYSRDTSSNENHVVVMLEANVFSNKAVGKKNEAKAIFSKIDEIVNNLGFTRQTMMPMSMETSIRIIGRWTAVVGKDETIFRR